MSTIANYSDIKNVEHLYEMFGCPRNSRLITEEVSGDKKEKDKSEPDKVAKPDDKLEVIYADKVEKSAEDRRSGKDRRNKGGKRRHHRTCRLRQHPARSRLAQAHGRALLRSRDTGKRTSRVHLEKRGSCTHKILCPSRNERSDMPLHRQLRPHMRRNGSVDGATGSPRGQGGLSQTEAFRRCPSYNRRQRFRIQAHTPERRKVGTVPFRH